MVSLWFPEGVAFAPAAGRGKLLQSNMEMADFQGKFYCAGM